MTTQCGFTFVGLWENLRTKHPKKLSETKRNPEEDWEGNPNQPPPGGGKKDLFVCLFVPYFPVFAQFYCVSG
jgi:hypothetical protein